MRVGDVAVPHRIDAGEVGLWQHELVGPGVAATLDPNPLLLVDVLPDPAAFALASGLRPSGEGARGRDTESVWDQRGRIDRGDALFVVTTVADLSDGAAADGTASVRAEFRNDVYQAGTGRHVGSATGVMLFVSGAS